MCTPSMSAWAARGLSMIELIIFIVVIGIAVAGVLLLISTSVKSSSDPLVRKQVVAIAEAMLEEVQLMPFTYCDPDDVNATSATSSAGCTGGAGGVNDESRLPLVADSGELRYGPTQFYDNVKDYNGFSMTGVRDINNQPIPLLNSYQVSVTVTQATLTSSIPASSVASPAALKIGVTVVGPRGETVTLEGWRTRYAPRSP